VRSSRAEFPKAVREEAWVRCGGRCEGICKEAFAGRVPEYHHLIPASLGGPNTLLNCRVLCPKCHKFATKSETQPLVSKAKRLEEKRAGIRRSKYQWRSRSFSQQRG
jgi:5-methylcytosine-specific restriction enzyme A